MDRYLSLTQVAELFPGHDNSPGISLKTVRRWVTTGVRGVVLETVAIGGRVYSTEAAVKEFMVRCTASRNGNLNGTQRRRRAPKHSDKERRERLAKKHRI